MKTGLVLEGGALRTIYSTGVLDAMLSKDLMVDYVIGVSAGACADGGAAAGNGAGAFCDYGWQRYRNGSTTGCPG